MHRSDLNVELGYFQPPAAVEPVKFLNERFPKIPLSARHDNFINWSSPGEHWSRGVLNFERQAAFIVELLEFGNNLPVATELALLRVCRQFADAAQSRNKSEMLQFAQELFTWANEVRPANEDKSSMLGYLLNGSWPNRWSFDSADQFKRFSEFCRILRHSGGAQADFAVIACLSRCADPDLASEKLKLDPKITAVCIRFVDRFRASATELLREVRRHDLEVINEIHSLDRILPPTAMLEVLADNREVATDPMTRLKALNMLVMECIDGPLPDVDKLKKLDTVLFASTSKVPVNEILINKACYALLGDCKLTFEVVTDRLSLLANLIRTGDVELSSAELLRQHFLGLGTLMKGSVHQFCQAVESATKDKKPEAKGQLIKEVIKSVDAVCSLSGRFSLEQLCSALAGLYGQGFSPSDVDAFIKKKVKPIVINREEAVDVLDKLVQAIKQAEAGKIVILNNTRITRSSLV